MPSLPWSDILGGNICSTAGTIILLLLGAGGWTTVYITSIYIGFKEKTYCIPFVSLCINYAWELYFSFSSVQCGTATHWCAQRIINIVWCLFDTLIVIQLLIYGYKYFSKIIHKYVWYSTLIFIFSSALTFINLFQASFDPSGGIAAFADNYLMSCLFISFFYVRKATSGQNLEGQSLIIAICKFIGTLANSISWGLCSGMNAPVLVYIYVMIALLDVFYTGLLFYAKYTKKEMDAAQETEMSKNNEENGLL